MYATYDYYVEAYLSGKDASVPEKEFPFWEKQAEKELDHVTFDRIKNNQDLITDDVKDCVCELTEYLYQQDQYSQASSEDGNAGQLASYSNDGESASYDLASLKDLYSASAKGSKIQGIINKHLSRTGLLYRGFY